METKQCSRCHKWKPVSEFGKNRSTKDGLHRVCRECARESTNQSSYRRGIRKPLGTNPDCASYLGVCVAERVLSHIFEHVTRMPFGNPGYDFTCRRGYKIDVKSGCRYHREGWSDWWLFHIDKNTTADYFLLLAFDDRKSLTPEHVWLIPGSEVSDRVSVGITESRLKKWAQYELHDKLEDVVKCCNAIRA